MLKRQVVTVLVLLAGILGAGCGDDTGPMGCEEACQWTQDHQCPGAKTGDCATLCQGVATLNDKAQCASQYSSLASCLGSHRGELTCGNSTYCTAEASAYASCIVTYCSAVPTPAEC